MYGNDRIPVWVHKETDGIFKAGSLPVESLEQELQVADFAALVLSPDDTVISRDGATDAPRDNIVLELGFLIGALSRLRTLLGLTSISLTKDRTNVLVSVNSLDSGNSLISAAKVAMVSALSRNCRHSESKALVCTFSVG